MKEIRYSLHCLQKISILSQHKFDIEIEFVDNAIKNPDLLSIGKNNRFIAQKEIDENHILRVIYEENEYEIFVVTIYPGRKVRYEKN